MRIRFTKDPKLPRDWANLPYRAGVEVDLSPDQAERWIRRDCAVEIPDVESAAVVEVVTEVVSASETTEPVAPAPRFTQRRASA